MCSYSFPLKFFQWRAFPKNIENFVYFFSEFGRLMVAPTTACHPE